MDDYVPLCSLPTENGLVDYIINSTKKQFVNLGGANSTQAIVCVYRFLCRTDKWNINDRMAHRMLHVDNIQKSNEYEDISYMLESYCSAKVN